MTQLRILRGKELIATLEGDELQVEHEGPYQLAWERDRAVRKLKEFADAIERLKNELDYIKDGKCMFCSTPQGRGHPFGCWICKLSNAVSEARKEAWEDEA